MRRLAWTTVVLVAVPVLIVVGAVLALRAGAVRRAVVGELADFLRKQYGLAVTVEDFSPFWRRSGLALRNVRVGAPGAAPFATAAQAEVRIDLGSLRSRPVVIRSLDVDGLRVDLAAPLPKMPESPPGADQGPGVEIQGFTVRNGEVRGAPLAKPAADWVRGWSARGIAAQGSLRGGRLEAVVERGTATLDRPGYGLQDLQVSGKVAYADGQPLRADDLRVTGDGLRLAGSATVGLAPGQPTAARFELDAEPRVIAKDLPPGGSLHASGDVDLAAKAGRVAVAARAIPAEALRRYVDPKLYADLALAGTAADLDGQAALGSGDWTRVEGSARASWRRGSRPLARADLRLSPGAPPALIVATLSADLLPGSPGRRAVSGTVRAAGWAALADATAEGVRAQVELPDVRAALAEVRALWPRLVPQPPAGTPLLGSLAADVRLSGPLAAPAANVEATWKPQPGASVQVEAKGEARTWRGTATVRTEALPLGLLAAWAPGLAGTVTGTAHVSGSPRAYETRVEATTAALAYPPSLERLVSATVHAAGTLSLHPLRYQGTLDADGAGLFAAPAASATVRLASFRLTSDGALRLQPLSYQGKVGLAGQDADVPGTARAESFELAADGAFEGASSSWNGPLSLDARGVDIPGTARVDHLQVASDGRLGADLGTLAATVRVDADRVALPAQGLEVRGLHAEAQGNGPEVRITALSGELPPGRTFNATGRAVVRPLLAEADLDLHLVKPVDAVAAADLTARLRDGVLEVDASRLDTASGPATLHARVPLAALRAVPALAPALDALPWRPAEGPVTLALQAPALDSEPLLAALGMEPRPERVRAGVVADLTLDPAAPAAGRGEVRLTGLSVETPDGRVVADGPAVLRLAEGRLDLLPVHLRAEGGAVQGVGADLKASAELARTWRPTDPPLAAITRISAEAGGTLDAALLDPYLQGAAATGNLQFTARASGPPDALSAEVEARGPGAAFILPSAGVRVQDPVLAADLREGRWTIREGRAGVNGGTAEIAGGLSPKGDVDLQARLARVRYRLQPWGIDTVVSGPLAFRMSAGGRGLLSGTLRVERGVLDRDLDLDREVLTALSKPPSTPSTEASLLADVDLSLAVETTDGVRVRNNVADLRASWQRLEVGGTLDVPAIRGRITLDPGGLLYAYGQTVRVDRGSLTFTGDPVNDPKIDLATTTSLQDPTISQLRGASPLDLLARREEAVGPGEDQGPDARATLTSGLTGYFGARVFGRFGETLGLTVRPELIFTEANPSARLVVGRALSRSVSLALSVDLRNAERQTYLVYAHELRVLPGLTAEGFTNDVGHRGGALQQVLTFGGTPGGGDRARQEAPRLRRIEISTPKGGISKRSLGRAIRLRKRDPVPEGAEFGVELDLTEVLRAKGYPDPRIAVVARPAPAQRGRAAVDLAVTVEPGPRVRFAFAGDRPPRALRGQITALYRSDFFEAGSLDEMKRAVVRAFRARGHVSPKVEIEVKRERPDDPDGARTVTVRTEAGRRRSLDRLEIAGLDDPQEAALVAAAFPGTLARAELAAGHTGADALLVKSLQALGYPEARIATRFVAADGSRLVVGVDPGPRQSVAAVRVEGVGEGEAARLLAQIPLKPGAPARLDLAAAGKGILLDDLHARGYADAAVTYDVSPAAGQAGEAVTVEVVYAVEPGATYRLTRVDVSGARSSSRSLLLREAGLRPGATLTEADVEAARDRLYRTGVLSRVDAEVVKDADGGARVAFALAERPRFRLGYGLRYESSVGTGAVFDAVDQNFLGRAITLGLRALYQDDDRSGRLYLQTGGVLGTRISLESYAEGRRRIRAADNLIEDRDEVSLQASRPWGGSGTARVYARYRTSHLFEIHPDPFFPFDSEIRLPYVGAQVLRDTRDDPIDARRGTFASLDLSGSGTFLGSDFRYVRLFGQLSSFSGLSLGGLRLGWAQSVRAGIAHPFGQEMIRDERFFAGGPFSVRGYEMESLGPRESLGPGFDQATGGEALFVLNEELRVPLPLDLTGLAFFDAGQVWARPRDVGFDLAKSLGLGLRASTPLGLVRLDAAFPLDRRPGDARYKLYFGFGNTF